MTFPPQVSIVLPVFNDEEHVAAALETCLNQTLNAVEIIVVDDASTDSTTEVVEKYALRDARIKLIRQPENRSAFQARRAGIDAASAPYILFLDGDDELSPHAAKTALARAQKTGADVVGFGVDVVAAAGVPSRLEAALQPRFDTLATPHIVPRLFPVGELPQGHLWRYLFSTAILRAAYKGIGEDVAYYRANDLPITFLALAEAKKYASTPERLYRYHFRRGTSGHAIDGVEHFAFFLSGVEPIISIGPRIRDIASRSAAGADLLNSYESARLQVIASVLRYCVRDTLGDIQKECLALLQQRIGLLDTVRAAAAGCVESLPALSLNVAHELSGRPAKRILLSTRRLDTGGLQAVVIEQARQLSAVGHHVTIVTSQSAERDVDLPLGVEVVHLAGDTLLLQLDSWLKLCRDRDIDMVIDHYMLYNETWPWFALVSRAIDVAVIGWVHAFALRPLFDQTQRVSFITTHAPLLLHLVTLSPTDVAFWKLRGVNNAVYLPNPVSPLSRAAFAKGSARSLSGQRLELAWWGRLDRSIKQVHHLVDVAATLRSRGIDFRLSIIGPDSGDLTASELARSAQQHGVDDAINLVGELDSDQLLTRLHGTDLLVSTSAVEGFQLTIVEAQAFGLPVVMYDLPWLVTVRGNKGLVTTAPGDAVALANEIAEIADNPDRYAELSRAAREFASSSVNRDVGSLTAQLVSGELSDDFSPEPTLDDARLLVEWLVRISEHNAGADAQGPRAEIIALRRERDRAKATLQHVTDGPSFKIGRALTSIPRKARQILRTARSTGNPPRPAVLVSTTPPPPLRRKQGSGPIVRSVHPDVTFVIPVYNSAPWLDDCLSSILAQGGVSVEVICVNDGSTDDSLEILNRFAEADPRVSVISQPNSGQSVGRNRGLDEASGRYIIYLDSDDYWPYDALASLVERADAETLDVLLFDCAAFLDGDVDEKTWRWYSTYYQRTRPYREVRTGVDLMVDMRRNKEYRPHVGLYMARTSYVRRSGIRFIPGIVHQDNPYTFRLMLHAARTGHQRVDAYARRIRPGSTITSLTSERSARGYYLSYLEMMRELEGMDLSPAIEKTVDNIVSSVYEGARKQFAVISPSTVEDLRALDTRADASLVIDSLVKNQD